MRSPGSSETRTTEERRMGESSGGARAFERSSEDRLDSWKEIAAYLNRDVTTVQRWEKREGMPVYRHLHDRIGSVYASRVELDDWTFSRNLQTAHGNGLRCGRDYCCRTAAAPRSIDSGNKNALAGDGDSCCWPRCWRSPWRLQRDSGCRGRITSGEAHRQTHASRPSQTSADWSRPLRCRATGIL